MRVAALLLAAGASTRMGRPKALLAYRGQSLARRAVAAARASRCADVRVVLGADADAIAAELADLDVRTIVNADWREGQGASIRAGAAAISEATPPYDALLILLVDQPHIEADHIDRLIECFAESGAAAVATRYADELGAPALFGRQCFAELQQLAGDRGARRVLRAHRGELASVPNESAALDIDDPADYARLLDE